MITSCFQAPDINFLTYLVFNSINSRGAKPPKHHCTMGGAEMRELKMQEYVNSMESSKNKIYTDTVSTM